MRAMQPLLRSFRTVALAASAALAATATPASAQAPVAAAFDARTVSDLATLCGTTQANADGQAALAFCHGFFQGAGQYHGTLTQPGSRQAPVFCVPNPPPTRMAAAQSFVAWAKANPQFGAELAVDGLARWARTTYPCPAAAPRR
jgi:hypothetical protein